jgi:two-component system, OmpR family, phosphate regulon sensor histidine kinase PhoR
MEAFHRRTGKRIWRNAWEVPLVTDDRTEQQQDARPFRILVMDDEPGILRGCERVLKAEGHEVLLADRGEKGLELIRSDPEIDLALVDLRMPDMGGLEVLSRAREWAPETVFVVITAYATLEAAIEATKRGAYDFLAKPFAPDELLRLVHRSLERVRLLRERNRLEAERRRRMLELATEQSRLRTIIDCMAEGVLVCNAEQELVLYNPAALKALAHDAQTPTPTPVAEAVQTREIVEMIAEAIRQPKRLSRELRLGPQGGWALADVAPVTDQASGQLLGTVTVLRDITQMKKVEQVKAQFMNMVAHELRAPLAAVDGYLAVMLEGLATDPAKQTDMLARSRQRLRALLDLVSDLLDVARMEAGTVRREIGPQRIESVLHEVVDLMGALAQQASVSLQLEASPDLPPVEADREELIRLFSNLVSNAIKYNRPEGRVTVTARQAGPYVEVSVTDTGVGISAEGVRKLFSEFFREKTAGTRHVVGTGLGLSIVKRIVDFYHGRVEVQSQPGEGSTFTVWLPFRQEAG